ncbi:glycosyltransferase [Microbacterium oleivorans]|uniref:Glycosyltransferase n=1 Tax=Microbacterium oleivorans TaxID=273677 RepID=A0A7D5ESS3_9MICO|nr:glycosyltransferase [Microbacterium oleivorans]QLD12265.1 glycosyltransferase [Microbacterium oleivorans]
MYNSASELVRAGRAAGNDWHAVLGVSSKAGSEPRDEAGIFEFTAEPGGVGGVVGLSRRLMSLPQVRDAELVVSLVPQTDMALSISTKAWVAYLRGLPWPARGEANSLKSAVWKILELTALRRARDVWATTPMLARETGSAVKRLVPPGIARPSAPSGDHPRNTFVWAARYSADKNPLLFADALRDSSLSGIMYGAGPMADRIRDYAPSNVSVPGWAAAGELWANARAYVGTSSREAFGRSAVEAAMLGIPPIISSAFGCAEMLYTDAELARVMIIDSPDPTRWRAVMERVASDQELHDAAAAHARQNSLTLTVEASAEYVAAAALTAAEVSFGRA